MLQQKYFYLALDNTVRRPVHEKVKVACFVWYANIVKVEIFLFMS